MDEFLGSLDDYEREFAEALSTGYAQDEFLESEHPRDEEGKFTTHGVLHSAGFKQSEKDPNHFNDPGGNGFVKVHPENGSWRSMLAGKGVAGGLNHESLKALLHGNREDWKKAGVAPSIGMGRSTYPEQKTISQLVQAAPDADKKETKAVQTYTTAGYKRWNKALREGGEMPPNAQPFAQWLDKASLPENTTLWRALSGKFGKQNWKVGDTIEDKGFTSTSASQEYVSPAVDAGDTVLKIEAKQGQKAATVDQMSNSPGQYEVVFQHGTRFRVKSVDGNVVTVESEQEPTQRAMDQTIEWREE